MVVPLVVRLLSGVWLFVNPMDHSTSIFPVFHYLPEFVQIHVHWVNDAIQPSRPSSPPSLPNLHLYQCKGLFQQIGSLLQVAKVKELQLQHQSLQWTFRVDFLYDWWAWSPYCPRDSQESTPFFNLSLNFAIRSSWPEPQSALGLVLADV